MTLISSPAKAWEEIRLEEDRRKVFMAFVYPMIGLCGLAVFAGSLLANGWGGPQSFQIAMTQCCAVAVALFGGYFLAAYAINQMQVKMFGKADDIPLTQQFAGYALVVTFLLKIITGLLPDFSIIGWLLQFYIVYVQPTNTIEVSATAPMTKVLFILISTNKGRLLPWLGEPTYVLHYYLIHTLVMMVFCYIRFEFSCQRIQSLSLLNGSVERRRKSV